MKAVRLDPFASRLLAIRLKSSDRPAQSATESAGTDLGDALPLVAHTETLAGGAPTEMLLDEQPRAVAPTDCQTCGVPETPQGEITMKTLKEEIAHLKARVENLEQRLLDVENDEPVYRSS